jgi:SAM-dependent methyltransferase
MIAQPNVRVSCEWSPTNATRRTQSYYVRREPTGDYANYWGKVVDPDGVVRNRTDEREQYLADIADETEFFRVHKFDTVADVGAGLGWFLEAIPAAKKIAVEVAPQALDVLSTKGWIVRTNACDLWTSHHDAIFCHHVIEHADDPVGMLHHIRRALVMGGWLVIATPDFGSPCAKRFGENYRLLKDPTHVSLFTSESMHRLLRDHGFSIRDVRFPFPERYATANNFARWNDASKTSPPWPGSFLTFYATKG